jgi:hypothetical protein
MAIRRIAGERWSPDWQNISAALAIVEKVRVINGRSASTIPPAAARGLPLKGTHMSTENTVADRLLADARRRTAKSESPKLGKVALVVGIIALITSPVSILGWIGGITALGLGTAAVRRPACAKQAKIAMALGAAAILVGVFFFTLAVSMH